MKKYTRVYRCLSVRVNVYVLSLSLDKILSCANTLINLFLLLL